MHQRNQRTKMLAAATLLLLVIVAEVNSMDITGACIRNCAQCKKMFGRVFEGQLCADTCVKFKGRIFPDCEDIASIAPFLNTID